MTKKKEPDSLLISAAKGNKAIASGIAATKTSAFGREGDQDPEQEKLAASAEKPIVKCQRGANEPQY